MRQCVIYCNRTATGLVQPSTQRTKVVPKIANNPINKPNYRTHQDALERTTSDCGTGEGRGFEPRRSPPLLQVKLSSRQPLFIALPGSDPLGALGGDPAPSS